MSEYIKVSKFPIEIHHMPDEDPRYDFAPSFLFNGARYWLKDFIRCHGTPWINSKDFPEYIDAFQGNEYNFPLYIHMNADQTIEVYIRKE